MCPRCLTRVRPVEQLVRETVSDVRYVYPYPRPEPTLQPPAVCATGDCADAAAADIKQHPTSNAIHHRDTCDITQGTPSHCTKLQAHHPNQTAGVRSKRPCYRRPSAARTILVALSAHFFFSDGMML
jgi:hypothetical protein